MANVIAKLRHVPIWIQLGKNTDSVYYTDANSMQIDSAGLLNLTMKRVYSKPETSDDGYRFLERRAGIALNCQDRTYAVTATGLFNRNNEIVHIYGIKGEFDSSRIVFSRTTEEDGVLHDLTKKCEVLSDLTKQGSSLTTLEMSTASSKQSSVVTSKNADRMHQDGNEAIEYCERADTTLERKKREGAAVNKDYRFRGSIFDIKAEREIVVRLSSGHYADVLLADDVGSSLRKNQDIKFNGILFFIGTGVLLKHTIKNAYITAR